MIAINKWDVAEGASQPVQRYPRPRFDDGLAQVKGLPLIAVSAKTGKGLDQMLARPLNCVTAGRSGYRPPALNRWFDDALEANPPPAPGGKRIKLRYITQAGTRPAALRDLRLAPRRAAEKATSDTSSTRSAPIWDSTLFRSASH